MGMKKLCVALVAIALGAVTVAPARAAQAGNKIVEIKSVSHDLFIDMTRRYRVPFSLATCTGSTAQRFELVPVATGGGIVRSIADGSCFDSFMLAMDLRTFWCNTDYVSRRGELVPSGPGTFKLRYRGKFAEVLYTDLGVRSGTRTRRPASSGRAPRLVSPRVRNRRRSCG